MDKLADFLKYSNLFFYYKNLFSKKQKIYLELYFEEDYSFSEIAEEYGVPVVENVPLARALYRELEIGDSIPESLYKAVAEVLAFVYRLKRGDGMRRLNNSPVQYGRRG